MAGYLVAKPLSKKDIRFCAMEFRRFLKLGKDQRVNVARLLDLLSILLAKEGFQYEILPDNDGKFGPREEAVTDVASGTIYIKQSVMDQACRRRYNRAAYTIAHEIGHYVLHHLLNGASFARARVRPNGKPKPYEDPEWQANIFAEEFLMPAESAMFMTADEIRKTFRVSKKCACVRYEKLQKEINDGTLNKDKQD